MSDVYGVVKVAAVQAAPCFLDREKTVEKTCALIDEAGSNGAKLIAFPETYIPGYPWWLWLGDPGYGMPFFVELYKNAVSVPSLATQRISEAARRNKMYVCVSVTEKDGGSLYLTQLWFDPKGDMIGRHRKQKPSSVERSIWGEGDGSHLKVFDTEIGRLGGLECWEHLIPGNMLAMNAQNEQIHVQSWPTCLPSDDAVYGRYTLEIGAKAYSIINQVFSVVSSAIYTQEMRDMLCQNDAQRAAMPDGHGMTMIIDPMGHVMAELPPDEEGICYADCDLSAIIPVKYFSDPAGQYSTPGHLRMTFDRSPHRPVSIVGSETNDKISYEALQSFEEETK